MNKKHTKLTIIISLLIVVFTHWFSYQAINELTDHFVEMEIAKEKLIVDLVKNNYDAISSITKEQKDTVISNFSDANLAGSNIKIMRKAALYILHPMFSGLLLYLIYKLFISYRRNKGITTHSS